MDELLNKYEHKLKFTSEMAVHSIQSVPMELINQTIFRVFAFRSVDQHKHGSQVVVIRATLDIKADGTLAYSGEQDPIALTDEYFGDINESSVKQESDLAPFKPECDIIVNATAYAPGGKPSPRFIVEVRINSTDDSAPPILEKKLIVTGPCCWEKRLIGGWALKEPVSPIASLPIRYEYAFGGECRISQDDPDCVKVEEEFRLTPEQRYRHPDGPATAPIAHAICENNPLGMGYVEKWYLKAKGIKIFPAPRIHDPENPVTTIDETYAPNGFGVVSRQWKQRLQLAGTYDGRWSEERWPDLPVNFDMTYWNGANPDMRTPHLAGGERITLTNLTPDGKLHFTLPDDTPFVNVFYEDGKTGTFPAKLDTLVIEPDSMKVAIVWRAVVPTPPEITTAKILLTPGAA